MKWIKLAVKLAVAAGILAALFVEVGSAEIWQAVCRLDLAVFGLAVVGYGAMQALKAQRLQVLLRALDVRLAYLRVLGIYFIGMFFNTVLPTIVGGDAVRMGYLYRETGRADRAAASVVTERAVGVGALILIAVLTLAFTGYSVGPRVMYAVLFVMAGFAIGLMLLFSSWVYRLAVACMQALRLGKAARLIQETHDAIATYRRCPGVLAATLFYSLLAELVMIGIYALLAQGVHIDLPLDFFLMAVPVSVLVSMAPVTISGLGVRELTWVFFLTERGVSRADAIALSLLWFAVVTVSSMFGGPVFVAWGTPPPEPPAPAPGQ